MWKSIDVLVKDGAADYARGATYPDEAIEMWRKDYITRQFGWCMVWDSGTTILLHWQIPGQSRFQRLCIAVYQEGET